MSSRNARRVAGRVLTRLTVALLSSLLPALAEAQIGCTLKQAKEWFDLDREQEDELFLKDGWKPTQFRARPMGKPGPTFLISFYDDRAVCIRPEDPSKLEFKDVIAGLNTFGWRVDGDERKQVRWNPTHAFLSAFPPVGKSSQNVLPLTRTVGRKKTITFDASTGVVLGATPWSDLDVPTGRFMTFKSGESCSVDTLVSQDGYLYARLVTSSSQIATSSYSSVSQFLICNATYYWKLSTQCISEGYDRSLYEFSFNRFVPKELQPEARSKRLIAAYIGLVNSSAVEPKVLAEFAKDIPEPRDAVQVKLSHLLHKQEPAVQVRRIEALAAVFGPEAIGVLVPMTRQPRHVGEKAAALIRGIAADHGLGETPDADATTVEWQRWAERVTTEDE